MLARRLAGCGVALSAGALAAAVSQGTASAQVPAVLVSGTAKAAALVAAGQLAAVATPAALLMKGVMKAMLFQKLRLAVGVVLVLGAVGALGLGYQAGGGSGTAQAAPQDRRDGGRPTSELEALRRENELLKLNLEVVLEKVRAQENELRELRGRKEDAGKGTGGMPGMPGGMRPPGMGGGPTMPGSGGSPMGSGMTGGPPGGMMGGRGMMGAPPGGMAGGPGVPGPGGGMIGGPPSGMPGGGGFPGTGPGRPGPATGGPGSGGKADPVQEAEAALKRLREARDAEGRREAADALEKALHKLKEQRQGQ
jgi:hypothetical protein